MKLIKFLTFASVALAQQITIFRPDQTSGSFSASPGCYGIFPSVSRVDAPAGVKVEFFSDSNCGGQKLGESTGPQTFGSALNAVSVRVGGGGGGNPTQVTILRPDNTSGSFSAAPGCYGIYPTVSKISGPAGLKYEFFSDYSCSGQKVAEAIGDKEFNPAIQAVTVRVSANAPQFYNGGYSQFNYYSPTPNYYTPAPAYYNPAPQYYNPAPAYYNPGPQYYQYPNYM
jgi:hypothetical protein